MFQRWCEDFVANGIMSALSPSPMVALVSGELARATEGALVAVPISLHTSFFRSHLLAHKPFSSLFISLQFSPKMRVGKIGRLLYSREKWKKLEIGTCPNFVHLECTFFFHDFSCMEKSFRSVWTARRRSAWTRAAVQYEDKACWNRLG